LRQLSPCSAKISAGSAILAKLIGDRSAHGFCEIVSLFLFLFLLLSAAASSRLSIGRNTKDIVTLGSLLMRAFFFFPFFSAFLFFLDFLSFLSFFFLAEIGRKLPLVACTSPNDSLV